MFISLALLEDYVIDDESFKFANNDGLLGVCPVFKTYEQAKEFAPLAHIEEVKDGFIA